MIEKLNGKTLSTSVISKARFELGLESRYPFHRSKMKRNKPSYEYWSKVIFFLGAKYGVDVDIIRRVRLNRRFFHMKPFVRLPRISIVSR